MKKKRDRYFWSAQPLKTLKRRGRGEKSELASVTSPLRVTIFYWRGRLVFAFHHYRCSSAEEARWPFDEASTSQKLKRNETLVESQGSIFLARGRAWALFWFPYKSPPGFCVESELCHCFAGTSDKPYELNLSGGWKIFSAGTSIGAKQTFAKTAAV